MSSENHVTLDAMAAPMYISLYFVVAFLCGRPITAYHLDIALCSREYMSKSP